MLNKSNGNGKPGQKNYKPVMSAVKFSAGGTFPKGIYMLYATGDGVNFENLQRIVGQVPHFDLGPFCWLISLPPESAPQFAETASLSLPSEDGKAELLLCYLEKTGMFSN
jgi:hypothetical protein